MFKVILETQWKWARMPLLLATVAAFTIPMISGTICHSMTTETVTAHQRIVLISQCGPGIAINRPSKWLAVKTPSRHAACMLVLEKSKKPMVPEK